MNRSSFLVFALILLLSGCAGLQPTAPSIEADSRESLRLRAIEFSVAVVRASASGWAANEVAALVDFYTEDAVLFPPKGDPIRGREAVKGYWTRTIDRRILEHVIKTERADIDGNLAADYGTFTLSSQSGALPPQRGSSNFISVWRRGEDGLWRKQVDSWW